MNCATCNATPCVSTLDGKPLPDGYTHTPKLSDYEYQLERHPSAYPTSKRLDIGRIQDRLRGAGWHRPGSASTMTALLTVRMLATLLAFPGNIFMLLALLGVLL